MALTARLNSPSALYRKLEREAYRAFHATMPLHKADHFLNFCVTSASMRDYILEHLGMLSHHQKQPFFDEWSSVSELVAAEEIGNSTKHFVLRDRRTSVPRSSKTKAVRLKKARFGDVYMNAAGEMKVIEAQRTEVHVTLSDGTILDLYSFTSKILDYWKNYLEAIGIRVRRQPFAQLSGRDA